MARGKEPNLTAKDREVLAWITHFIAEHGRSPTLREIARGMSWEAHGTAQRHVNVLLATGQLERDDAGRLGVPGERPPGPRMARVLGTDKAEWVAAPEAGLAAWRGEAGSAGSLVFLDQTIQATEGDWVVVDTTEGLRLRTVCGQPQRHPPPARDTFIDEDGEEVEVVGVVRFLQREVPIDRGAGGPATGR